MNMPRLFLNISMSLDGFVAGRNITLEQPLGENGERLHDWTLRLAPLHRVPGPTRLAHQAAAGRLLVAPASAAAVARPGGG